jgi:predicted methyltransferase
MMNTSEISVPDYISNALASTRRPDEDRARDEPRKIAQVLSFFDVKPGQRVADLMASRGYIAALLTEIVGDEGVVYTHNSEALLGRFKGNPPIPAYIEKHGIKNIVDLVAELEDLSFPEPLDAAFSFMFYHDTVWVGTDRAKMNKAIHSALKPGGIFAVVDHDTLPGKGTSQAQDLHRVERATVVAEVTAAGFELIDESDLLANPDDPMDKLIFDKSIRDKSNKYVLKFRA